MEAKMVSNLVSLAMQSLSSDIITKISSARGLDRSVVGQAINATGHALRESFAGAAAKPGGMQRISEAIDRQDSGVINGLRKSVEGSGYKALSDKGSGLLASMLGSSTQTGLTRVIGKYAGLDEKTTTSLLGFLAPVVVGAIKKQQGTSSLSPSGLANLLASQKDNISEALPTGVENLLGDAGILDDLGDGATTAAKSVAQRATDYKHAAQYEAAKRGPSLTWLAWALPIIALAALAWYLLAPRTMHTVEAPATMTTKPATVGLMVDGVDIGASVTSTIDNVKTTLESVTDSATAKSALPKLEEATTALDKVSGSVDK